MWFFSQFVETSTSSSFLGRLLYIMSKTYVLEDKRVWSYAITINWLLITHSTDEVLTRTVTWLESYEHSPWVALLEFSKRLYTKTLRSGPLHNRQRVELLKSKNWRKLLVTMLASIWIRIHLDHLRRRIDTTIQCRYLPPTAVSSWADNRV